ncbi:hypothetical protein [Pseudobacillus wudalianchiensis]|uniref:Uncharacterized protein n=1 Tax=Pseudobacillus wudalianchiensis TaxID=1743143 RepID=A0A1B9B908_9BACI|nr:hypothetical protein [Bacillus wudalianchiensis]OCA92563.1 hypothetical protein A8F95_02370 [Bacillus wudalianchiensis]
MNIKRFKKIMAMSNEERQKQVKEFWTDDDLIELGLKCKQCGSENCNQEEVYWQDGKQFLVKVYCKDCKSYSD